MESYKINNVSFILLEFLTICVKMIEQIKEDKV